MGLVAGAFDRMGAVIEPGETRLVTHLGETPPPCSRSYTRAFRFKYPDSQMPLLAGTTVVLGKATFEVACRTS